MYVKDFYYKALFVVSSTAQVEMFKVLVNYLNDFEIKFINIDISFNQDEIKILIEKYGFNCQDIDNYNMRSVVKILKKENPNIIITGNDVTLMDLLFIKAANKMDIPSITVQDGTLVKSRHIKRNKSFLISLKYLFNVPLRILKLIFNSKYQFKFKISQLIEEYYRKDIPFIYGHGESSKIALFGETTKSLLISEGIPPEKLEITGNPKFDSLFQYKDPELKLILKKRWDIPSEKKVVTILTQYLVESNSWTSEQRRFFISKIANACFNLPNVQLIIKLHPSKENKDDYHKILEDLPISALLYQSEPLHEIITLSDVIISVSSTSALEAMALDKPVLIINMDSSSKFFKDGGVLFIEETDPIQPALEKLLNHPYDFIDENKVKKFVYDQAYIIDGNASKRISNLIREMVSGSIND